MVHVRQSSKNKHSDGSKHLPNFVNLPIFQIFLNIASVNCENNCASTMNFILIYANLNKQNFHRIVSTDFKTNLKENYLACYLPGTKKKNFKTAITPTKTEFFLLTSFIYRYSFISVAVNMLHSFFRGTEKKPNLIFVETHTWKFSKTIF